MLKVLLVDDNPGDLDLVRETLEDGASPVRLSMATSGQAALELLQGNAPSADAAMPDLVLLDLNMPGVTGRDVLREIRRLAPRAPPVVVVLTSSDAEQDVQDSYRLGADGCITKPLSEPGWRALLQQLHQTHRARGADISGPRTGGPAL